MLEVELVTEQNCAIFISYPSLPCIPANILIGSSIVFALNALFWILILTLSHIFIAFTGHNPTHSFPLKISTLVGVSLFIKIIVSDLSFNSVV